MQFSNRSGTNLLIKVYNLESNVISEYNYGLGGRVCNIDKGQVVFGMACLGS